MLESVGELGIVPRADAARTPAIEGVGGLPVAIVSPAEQNAAE
ncbi:MAG TPA: hypothetical protein VFS43_17580 [Polyangiaceae bacterium]|nr:hypothetical protein [Polyangiaceae bacterium]